MSYPLLCYGSKGKDVVTLQKLLNQKLKKQDRGIYQDDIKINENFGSHTKEFVKNFQYSAFLLDDGVVGSKTWAALLGTEKFNCYDEPAKRVPATGQYDCWAATTATLLNQTSCNNTQPAGVDFESLGGGKVGGLKNTHTNMKKFANYHKMQMLEGDNMNCLQLCYLVYNFGRLMINVKGIDSGLNNSSPDDSHLMMILGMRGDGNSGGTTLRLYDPSGNNQIIDSYQYLRNRFPKMTYQVFYMLNNYSKPVY